VWQGGKAGLESFLNGLQRFGIGRLAAVVGVSAGAAAALFALVMHVGAEPEALLYSNLDLKEAASISQARSGGLSIRSRSSAYAPRRPIRSVSTPPRWRHGSRQPA